jgi:hypothetical protein
MTTQAQFASFLNGAVMVGHLVVGLLFARFYRDTGDKFFKRFSGSFVILAFERVVIMLSGGMSETYPGVYLLRLLAFATIIYAVVDKNKT